MDYFRKEDKVDAILLQEIKRSYVIPLSTLNLDKFKQFPSKSLWDKEIERQTPKSKGAE